MNRVIKILLSSNYLNLKWDYLQVSYLAWLSVRYILNLIVETDDDKEIPETFLEGDGPITKYLNMIGDVGGDFIRLVVHREYNGRETN